MKTTNWLDIVAHLLELGDGRSVALARTMTEYGEIWAGHDLGSIRAGFGLAGAIDGDGAIGARAATCRQIYDMIGVSVGDRVSAQIAWEKLIHGYEALATQSPPDARGRYDAIIATLRRELATF